MSSNKVTEKKNLKHIKYFRNWFMAFSIMFGALLFIMLFINQIIPTDTSKNLVELFGVIFTFHFIVFIGFSVWFIFKATLEGVGEI